MVVYGYHRPIKTNDLRNSCEGGCTHFPCRLWSSEFIPQMCVVITATRICHRPHVWLLTHSNSWNLDTEEQLMWHKCLHYLIQKGATSCLKLDAGDEKSAHFWWSNEHISINHNTCLSLNISNSSYVFEPTYNLTFNAFGWLGEFQKPPPSNPMIQALSICAMPEASLLSAMMLSI